MFSAVPFTKCGHDCVKSLHLAGCTQQQLMQRISVVTALGGEQGGVSLKPPITD